jgi:hypothetical protein
MLSNKTGETKKQDTYLRPHIRQLKIPAPPPTLPAHALADAMKAHERDGTPQIAHDLLEARERVRARLVQVRLVDLVGEEHQRMLLTHPHQLRHRLRAQQRARGVARVDDDERFGAHVVCFCFGEGGGDGGDGGGPAGGFVEEVLRRVSITITLE